MFFFCSCSCPFRLIVRDVENRVTEMAHDGINFAAHSKDYTQVIVPAGTTELGSSTLCKIIEDGRFFVRGIPVNETENTSTKPMRAPLPLIFTPRGILLMSVLVCIVAAILSTFPLVFRRLNVHLGRFL
jgi:hypothetical protein